MSVLSFAIMRENNIFTKTDNSLLWYIVKRSRLFFLSVQVKATTKYGQNSPQLNLRELHYIWMQSKSSAVPKRMPRSVDAQPPPVSALPPAHRRAAVADVGPPVGRRWGGFADGCGRSRITGTGLAWSVHSRMRDTASRFYPACLSANWAQQPP